MCSRVTCSRSVPSSGVEESVSVSLLDRASVKDSFQSLMISVMDDTHSIIPPSHPHPINYLSY